MLKHVNILYALLLGSLGLSYFSQFNIASAVAIASFSYILKNLLDAEAKKEPIANADIKNRLFLLEEKTAKLETKVGVFTLRK